MELTSLCLYFRKIVKSLVCRMDYMVPFCWQKDWFGLKLTTLFAHLFPYKTGNAFP